MAATISPARLRQLTPEGARTAVAALDVLTTGDPLLDAQLALAVVTTRHPGYAYSAVDEHDRPLTDEADPVVRQLRALLEPEITRIREARAKGEIVRPSTELEAQHAALAAIGRPAARTE